MQGLKIEDEQPVEEDIQEAFNEIRRKKNVFREEHALKKNKTAHPKLKDMEHIKDVIEEKGMDATLVEERLRNRSRSKSLIAIKNRTRG